MKALVGVMAIMFSFSIFSVVAQAEVSCGILKAEIKNGTLVASITMGEKSDEPYHIRILNPLENNLTSGQCTCVIGEDSPRDRAQGDDATHIRLWVTKRFPQEEKTGCDEE